MHLRRRLVVGLGVVAIAALAGCGGGSAPRGQPTPTKREKEAGTTTTTVGFVPSPEACWGTTTVPGSLQQRLALYHEPLTPTNVAACETFAGTVAPAPG